MKSDWRDRRSRGEPANRAARSLVNTWKTWCFAWNRELESHEGPSSFTRRKRNRKNVPIVTRATSRKSLFSMHPFSRSCLPPQRSLLSFIRLVAPNSSNRLTLRADTCFLGETADVSLRRLQLFSENLHPATIYDRFIDFRRMDTVRDARRFDLS